MSKTKIRIHPDARKAMMYFSAEPEKSSPITEADNLLISCINAPFSGSGVTSMIKQHEVRGYNKPVDMQESALQNGLYIFADCSDLRTELHKRAKRAFSHKKPGHGVELINTVSEDLQLTLVMMTNALAQCKGEGNRYINDLVSRFVNLCDSLGMMSYCHKILAKHNLDI